MEDDAYDYIMNKSLARFAKHGVGLWPVEIRGGGTPIGVCGLVVRKELELPDLGFGFLPQYRGKGYASEAAAAVLEFAHKEMKLRSLCAITNPDNIRSASLLRKVGFMQDGQRHLLEIGATADYYVWKLRYVEKGIA